MDYETIANDPRVQNCHPKFIARIDNKQVLLAEVKDGAVYLTEEGEAFFADEADAAPKAIVSGKKRASKKAQEMVVSREEAPEPEPEVNFDDLDTLLDD